MVTKFIGYRGIFAAAVVALVAAYSNQVQAQTTATSSADAVIATPISIINTAGLNFGTILANATLADTVTLTAAAAPTRTANSGNVTLLASTISAAAFTVNGTANQTFAITLPADPAGISISNGAQSMVVNGFAHSAGATPTLPAAPPMTLYVGATLNVGINQASGSYNGSFDVTVAYN